MRLSKRKKITRLSLKKTTDRLEKSYNFKDDIIWYRISYKTWFMQTRLANKTLSDRLK